MSRLEVATTPVFVLPGLGADDPDKVSEFPREVAAAMGTSRRRGGASLRARGADDVDFRVGDYHEFLPRSAHFGWENTPGPRFLSQAPAIGGDCTCCALRPTQKAHHRLFARMNDSERVATAVRAAIQRSEPAAIDFLRGAGFRAAIREHLTRQRPEGARVVLAHSLGSLVALDLMAHTDWEPDLLITFGSPIGVRAFYREFESQWWSWISERRTTWVNIHHVADGVTAYGGLAEKHFPHVLQIRVRHPGPPHAAAGYLSHPAVAQLVDGVASGQMEAASILADPGSLRSVTYP